MTVVQQSVQNCIGQGGIADGFMPLVDRQLAGDQGGPQAVAVLHDFQQVIALAERHLLQTPVVQYQEICFCQLLDQLGEAAIPVGDAQRFQLPRGAEVAY